MEVLWKQLWINAQRNTVLKLPGVNYDSSLALCGTAPFWRKYSTQDRVKE